MLEKECIFCGSVFKTYPSHDKRFCNKKCARDKQKQDTFDRYKQKCIVCGDIFLPKRPRDGGAYCSYKCSGIDRRKGKVDRCGYWFVCRPDHPRASKQGYVPEQYIVVEKDIGRYVKIGEVVHHIDGDKKNNNLDNLLVMTDQDHRRYHLNESIMLGKINTQEQRAKSSKRMKTDNPSKNIRDSGGRFVRGS